MENEKDFICVEETPNTEIDNKDKQESRFEFSLSVDDNLVCKRGFMMYDFIEGSMNTLEFKETADAIVEVIKNDLVAKSRVHTWYRHYKDTPMSDDEFEIQEPSIFKFSIYDNKREVYSRIWESIGYPRSVKNNVDLTNKSYKIRFSDGTEATYTEEQIESGTEKIPYKIRVMYSMKKGKEDLIPIITKMICETCTSWGNSEFKELKDYTLSEKFGKKKYQYNPKADFNKLVKDWEKATSKKTKDYFNKR